MILRFHPMALDDGEEAEKRLDLAVNGLGQEFAEALGRAVAAVEDRPRFYARVDDVVADVEVRELFMRRFQYRVIFALTDTEILVVAIAHAHRRPGYWLDRLPDEG